ncbi:MAG: hypothetical protein QXG85_00630, partial [Thermoproteota archaeon]
ASTDRLALHSPTAEASASEAVSRTRVEGGLRRSRPQQASLSACPMPTRSASQADNDKYNEKNISFSAFIPQLSQGDFPP